jgi:hypothetical protein
MVPLQRKLDCVAAEVAERALPRSRKVNGRFVLDKNAFPEYKNYLGGSNVFAWRWAMRGKTVPIPTEDVLAKELPVLTPEFSVRSNGVVKRDCGKGGVGNKTFVTWLGHASVLVEFDGWTVLADPVFSERCSPVQFAGPRRVRPACVEVADLPQVDFCVISHNHYDHLDFDTCKQLLELHKKCVFCVALGTKAWFVASFGKAAGERVVEFDWTDEAVTAGATATAVDSGEVVKAEETTSSTKEPVLCPLTIAALPCQHWCRRGLLDTNN